MDTSGDARLRKNYRPFETPMLDDPYPFFALARSEYPVFYSEQIDHWVVSRRNDILNVLGDPGTFSTANTIQPITALSERAAAILRDGGWGMVPALGNNDEPEHRRFRSNVNRAFTPRKVAQLEPFVTNLVNTELDGWDEHGECDLVSSFLNELPAKVILHLLGIPEEEASIVRDGADTRVRFIWGRPTAQQQEHLAAEMVRFWDFLRGLVHERRRTPTGDLTSDLLAVRDGDDTVLTVDEICSVLFAFLTAGHETTASLLANGIRRLLEHPTSWRELHADPSLVDRAVEEMLRYDSSVVAWRRRANQDTHIAGTPIRAGAQVLLLLGSANRDPETFDQPETLDIHRPNAADHLSFGHGIHFCLGASLARLEVRTVLRILSQRVPALRLASQHHFEFVPNVAFRAPLAVHVGW